MDMVCCGRTMAVAECVSVGRFIMMVLITVVIMA
jgi:hypothetical protein